MAIETLADLAETLRQFAAERDWDRFHTPKNLAAALVVEAAELLEQFQWLAEEEGASLSDQQLTAIRRELADVLIYLTRMADVMQVDLMEAARQKLEENRKKYPADLVRGRADKYTAYEND